MSKKKPYKKPKPHLEPRISANKLGSYIYALPAKRRSVLFQQKFPETPIVALYNDAVSCIARLITDGVDAYDAMLHELKFAVQLAKTKWELQKAELTLDAVRMFREKLLPQLQSLPNVQIIPMPAQIHHTLMIEGTEVSLRPDFIISFGTGKQQKVGYLKLVFCKTAPMQKPAAEIVALLLQMFAEQSKSLPADKQNRKAFLVADVFAGQLHESPASTTNRKKDIAAACLEIAQQWPAILPKAV